MSDAADPDFWVQRWDEDKTGWHKELVNPWLAANFKEMTEDRQNMKIFVPLCGKSVDMKWLADQGHHVVGVEVATKACEEFFTDSNIPYTTTPLLTCEGSVYESKDGHIQIYCCSIFDFDRTLAGQFDCIWDRGSLVALPPDLMEKYHAVMEPLMTDDCVYILERLDYDIPGKTGPPHCVPMETITTYYGPNCTIDVLDRFDSPEDGKKFNALRFEIEMIKMMKKR